MQFSPQQDAALRQVAAWLRTARKGGPQFFTVAGWAGTGKTELARHFAADVEGEVYFGAFTGKAAYVLNQRGCPNATTLHKLTYVPKDRGRKHLEALEERLAQGQGRLSPHELAKLQAEIRAERENLARPFFTLNLESPLKGAALLVLDEYSMVDNQLGTDVMSFGCPVLALGDPFQLPPVYGKPYFYRRPDVMLTEIHRQAKGNPIIWMATEVREGRWLPTGVYGESEVSTYAELGKEGMREAVLDADQLLVGRNDTRTSFNARVRQMRGAKTQWPEDGDRLVCLRNDHEVGLLNGQIWTTRGDARHADTTGLGALDLRLVSDEGNEVEVLAHKGPFVGEDIPLHVRRQAQEFTYGYALTVHKAQGSQFPKVLLYDEWRKDDHPRWLYTGLTRAQNKVHVVAP